ncbi:hypothetical protein [Dyella japonica]|nr:hypothetical protein [Dyella japonica]
MKLAAVPDARCERCRFFRDDPRETEQRVPGLMSFGSAYGASIAASALCDVHDSWVSPGDSCGRFEPVEG